MSQRFIIKIPHGGLGDHLFFSHLPRIAKTSGGARRVLISNLSEYRHPDYRRLIWEANPYVDGFTDEDLPDAERDSRFPEHMNLLDCLMLERGLDDGKRFHEPELYFKPQKIDSLAGTTIYDPNYVTNAGDLEPAHVEHYFSKNKTLLDYMLVPKSNAILAKGYKSLIAAINLEHYCSIIASSKRFFCLTSGGATLAASLGVHATVLWGFGVNTVFHHSKLHRYVNLNPLTFRLRAKYIFRRYAHALRDRYAAYQST